MKPVRYAVAFFAFGVLAGCVVLTLDRLFAPSGQLWVLLVSFTPYGVVGYAAALVLLLLVRRGAEGRLRRVTGVAAVVAALGLAVHVAWVAPAYVGAHASGRADVTVLELNMRYGQADPAALARLVRSQRPDIVVLLEAQPQSVAALAGAGVGGPSSPWHFHGGTPGPWITGTVVLSRWPVEQQRRLDILTGAWAMRIAAPQPFTLVAVHTSQPLSRRPLWLRDFGVLRATVPRLRGPALVAGDFNATLDHGPMRSLLGEGLTDAARQADSGMQETWPAPGVSTLVPRPMIAIDHVLTNRGFSAISTQTHVVPGTDHLALGVRLARR